MKKTNNGIGDRNSGVLPEFLNVNLSSSSSGKNFKKFLSSVDAVKEPLLPSVENLDMLAHVSTVNKKILGILIM